MEIFDGNYYRSCTWFLRSIGLWPYQNIFRRVISHIVFYIVNLSLAIPQAIALIGEWGETLNVMIENTVSLMFATVCVSKYTVTYINASRLDLLFLQVAKDWKTLVDKEERELLERYSDEGKVLVILYTVYLLFAWAMYTVMPFSPFFLDLFFPLQNGTRSLLIPFYANYVIFEQNDYHYWCCWHIAAVYFSSFFLYCGVDGAYVLTVKHTCGLFAITCNRIENMAKLQKYDESNMQLKKDSAVHHDLVRAITLHNETIRCFNLLEDSFNKCFLIVESLCVVGLALGTVYILFIRNDVFRFVRTITFMIGIVLHLLYLNWVGQQIINSSEHVFDSTYSSKWYLISTNARKFIHVIMIRSLNPCQLTAGKITTLSMESFGILIKTSMSYFTVFLSVA